MNSENRHLAAENTITIPVSVNSDLTILRENPIANKVGSPLASLFNEFTSSGTVETPQSRDFRLSAESVVINAVAVSDGNQLLTDLEALGLENGSVDGLVVSGELPIASIEEAANLESLKFAGESIAISRVGLVTSQGVSALLADDARSTFGFNGTGVTVGVLSDSYNSRGGAASDIANGDLPGTGNPLGKTTPVNVLQESSTGGIDEGRAMLQLIHDVAPGAELAFATAHGGEANFAKNIRQLATEAGADVIVDDIIYLSEPMFQDGIVARAVNEVVANGVAYFSAAGNEGRNSYESAFIPSSQNLTGFGQLHDFNPGPGEDVFQRITIPIGGRLIISFQWDSPFFSVNGGAGSPNDLDILLFNSSNTTILAGSNRANIGGDPVEFFSHTNFSSTTQFNLAIAKHSGPNPGLMKYIVFGDSTINEYNTNSPTAFGHPNASGAQAVGAAFYQQTPEFGVNPPVIESFSSPGPVPILFDANGNRLQNPEIRQKPEIVAPDGTNTTFFPPFANARNPEGDAFPNFFGTSAAAPHAAGVAALLLSADPTATPAEIYDALESTAIDMNDPFTPGFDTGFDYGTGFGLIRADRAIEKLRPDITSLVNQGFENGDFTGWETIGDTSIRTSSFGVTPSQGVSQAFMTNGLGATVSSSNLEAFLNLTPGALNNLGNGNASEGSAIKRTFTAVAGDTLTFDWNFLTNEATPSSTSNDFAFYTVSSNPTAVTAVELGDTTSPNFVNSPAINYVQQTGYRSVSINIAQTGTYTLGLGVVDATDNIVNSALIVDNLALV
jgi:subtilisin family serine protease